MRNITLRAPRSSVWLLAAMLALPVLLGVGSCRKDLRPVIFVHGGSGSGAQFESQAMRFTSNGYPDDYIAVVEYDSNLDFPEEIEVVHAAIDARIAELQADLGVEQVDLMGHSRGTTVSHDYLSTPERAAKVAHYVNIDGRSADAPPGGVPTLALWAGAVERDEQGEIAGAINITVPNQEHIEVATSEESFFHMYHFLRGRKPLTTKIIPEIRPRVSGRATLFPENFGLDGATLEVWRLDADTAERIGHPVATFAIGPDGHWGPFKAWFGQYYEFALSRPGELTLHYFYEPFLRSDHLVRLNVAEGLAPFITSSEDHTALTVVRFKEFWGDRGAENDVLAIDGTDVMNPVVAPSGAVGAASSAYFAFDTSPGPSPLVPGPPDGMTDLFFVPTPFPFVPFLTGSDLFIPTDPPGPVTVETVPRGDFDASRTIAVRNIPSTEARVVVQLWDFEP